MQRRMDIFIGGENEIDKSVWVMCMGHFVGNFDEDFLGIKKTRKLTSLRFAEFNCVENGLITKTGLFVDLIGLMLQANMYPLPPQTGNTSSILAQEITMGFYLKMPIQKKAKKPYKLSIKWLKI